MFVNELSPQMGRWAISVHRPEIFTMKEEGGLHRKQMLVDTIVGQEVLGSEISRDHNIFLLFGVLYLMLNKPKLSQITVHGGQAISHLSLSLLRFLHLKCVQESLLLMIHFFPG